MAGDHAPSPSTAAPAPVALITGGGSGIGRATALLLAKEGWRLGLVGRNRARLEDSAAACREAKAGAEIAVFDEDIAHPGVPAKVIGLLESQFGRLDALVNNAGIGESHEIRDTTRELLERTFAVNTFAPALFIAEAWKVFQRQPRQAAHDGTPCIINVSTLGTLDPFPGLFVYAASKIALESFVRSIVNESSRPAIRAFAIAPGAVETRLLRSVFSEEMIPSDRTMSPTRIAEVIADCILGRRNGEIGTVIRIPSA